MELNFCTQFGKRVGRDIVWFGLTQRQEARAGFDAAVKLGARLLLFQFKASNHTMAGGERRFHLQHDQLEALRERAGGRARSVFYVLPLVGTTHELACRRPLLEACWLMDANDLDGIKPPTKRNGESRKSQLHYADVVPNMATIRSDPTDVPLTCAGEISGDWLHESDGMPGTTEHGFEEFWRFRRSLRGTAAAAMLR